MAIGGGSEAEDEQADEELGIKANDADNSKKAKKAKGTGAVSEVQMTMENKEHAEKLVSKLLHNSLVADT